MSNKINEIINMIPSVLDQAKSQYVNDSSIIEMAKNKGVDLRNVLSLIQRYKNNPIATGIAKQFGVNIDAIENKFSNLVKDTPDKKLNDNGNPDNSLDKFR